MAFLLVVILLSARLALFSIIRRPKMQIGRLSSPKMPKFRGLPWPSPFFYIDIPSILAYAEDADEFVRLSCRGYAGWRRDEWAYSPLFICGKFPGFPGHFARF
jgi:hypothetical protein